MRNLKICSDTAPGLVAPIVPSCVSALIRSFNGLLRVTLSLSVIALRIAMLSVRLRLCAWIAISGAPSIWASTKPSELDAQKCAERPTTAFWHGAPPPAGVILARTPSSSKYLSCSATQTAENAMFPTAVRILTSGSCCAWIRTGVNAARAIAALRNSGPKIPFRNFVDANIFMLRAPRAAMAGFTVKLVPSRFADVFIGPEHAFFGRRCFGQVLDDPGTRREAHHLLPAVLIHVAPTGYRV